MAVLALASCVSLLSDDSRPSAPLLSGLTLTFELLSDTVLFVFWRITITLLQALLTVVIADSLLGLTQSSVTL